MKLSRSLAIVLFTLASAFLTHAHAQSFTQVAVGIHHLCGLSSDGSVDCSTASHATRYDTPDDLPAMQAITAGHQHSCGITLGGEAVCWGGDNFFNELDVPAIDQPLVDISAGVSHTCAVDITNRAWCWGLNDNEQIQVPGNGLGEDGTGFVKVSATGNASCGIQPNGSITCWSTDTGLTDTSRLTGRFTDVEISGFTGCGLKDTGDIQCWTTTPPPTNGPYTDLVVSPTAICGINLEQQLDCRLTSTTEPDFEAYSTLTRFLSIESGKLYQFGTSNFCGVTVDGGIECLDSVALPEVPGTSVDPDESFAAIDLGLSARIYGTNSIELFWNSLRLIPFSMIEVYRNGELVDTTDADFSWYDSSAQVGNSVDYSIRALDEFGNATEFSNTVTIDLVNRTVNNESLISEGSVVTASHTVDNIRIVSLATEIIISWDGSLPGTGGLQGYEVKVNNEVVGTTRERVFTSSNVVDGCNIVNVAAISDDNTIIDYDTDIFSRTRTSFGSAC